MVEVAAEQDQLGSIDPSVDLVGEGDIGGAPAAGEVLEISVQHGWCCQRSGC